MEPIHPKGTPEYEAYATELHAELGKFARGEEPYPYRREETAMPSVPNWIAKAVIYENSYTQAVTPTSGWRATSTQVVVTVATSRGTSERRFSLNSLIEVDTGLPLWRRAFLLAPDDPRVIWAKHEAVTRRARNHVRAALEEQRLDDSAGDVEATIKKLLAIRIALDEAIAQSGEAL